MPGMRHFFHTLSTKVAASILAATIHYLLLSTMAYNSTLEGLAVDNAIVHVVDAHD